MGEQVKSKKAMPNALIIKKSLSAELIFNKFKLAHSSINVRWNGTIGEVVKAAKVSTRKKMDKNQIVKIDWVSNSSKWEKMWNVQNDWN